TSPNQSTHEGGKPVPRYLTAGVIAVLSVILLGNVSTTFQLCRANQRTHYPSFSGCDTSVTWASYEQMFQWIEQNTPAEDSIAGGLDSMIALYTGRPAYRPFVGRPLALFYGQDGQPIGTMKELQESLDQRHARYLVRCPMPGFAEVKPLAQLCDEL